MKYMTTATITIQIRSLTDNNNMNNMNKFKLKDYSIAGIPQTAILEINGKIIALKLTTTSSYYDKESKTYQSLSTFYTIKNRIYA